MNIAHFNFPIDRSALFQKLLQQFANAHRGAIDITSEAVYLVPKAPFGVAWYQGDIVTDKNGRAHQMFMGRFNIETFAFAQGSAPAPVLFNNGVVPDASANRPSFNPIPKYHLGLWFDSPDAAQKARCPAAVTAFNGQHNAGFQVLNTSNFADDHGPLRDVTESSAKSANDEDRK